MKRMKLNMKALMIPLLLALLCSAVGGGCIMPWGWWDHEHGGERGYHHDSDDHHGSDGGDHHRDGHRD